MEQEEYTRTRSYLTDDGLEDYTAIDPIINDDPQSIYQNVGQKPRTIPQPPVDRISRQLARLNKESSSKVPKQLCTKNRVIPEPPCAVIPKPTSPVVKPVVEEYADQTPDEVYSEPRTFYDDDLPLVKFTKFSPDQTDVSRSSTISHDPEGDVTFSGGDVVPPTRGRSPKTSRDSCRGLTCPLLLLFIFLASAVLNGILVIFLLKPAPQSNPCTALSTGDDNSSIVTAQCRWHQIVVARQDQSVDQDILKNVASSYHGADCYASSERKHKEKLYNISRCQFALDGRQTWTGYGNGTNNLYHEWQSENNTHPWFYINFTTRYNLAGLELVHREGMVEGDLGIQFDSGPKHTLQLGDHPNISNSHDQVTRRILFPTTTKPTLSVNISAATSNDTMTGFIQIRVLGFGGSVFKCCPDAMPLYNRATSKCYFVSGPIRTSDTNIGESCKTIWAAPLKINHQSECVFLRPHIRTNYDVDLQDGKRFSEVCAMDIQNAKNTTSPPITDNIYICEAEAFCDNFPTRNDKPFVENN